MYSSCIIASEGAPQVHRDRCGNADARRRFPLGGPRHLRYRSGVRVLTAVSGGAAAASHGSRTVPFFPSASAAHPARGMRLTTCRGRERSTRPRPPCARLAALAAWRSAHGAPPAVRRRGLWRWSPPAERRVRGATSSGSGPLESRGHIPNPVDFLGLHRAPDARCRGLIPTVLTHASRPRARLPLRHSPREGARRRPSCMPPSPVGVPPNQWCWSLPN
jgi:hypothetical protein